MFNSLSQTQRVALLVASVAAAVVAASMAGDGGRFTVGINGVIETRCIGGFLYTIGPDGRPMQVYGDAGPMSGVRCDVSP